MMRLPSLQSLQSGGTSCRWSSRYKISFVQQKPSSLSNWLRKINEAGAAQAKDRRKPQTSRRIKNLVEMVERLKKRSK
jgi:hypothetical protein